MLLQRVSDVKTAESRIHLDLRLGGESSRTKSADPLDLLIEVLRPVEEAGWRCHVLADPDGNELCVLEPPPRYWARAGTDV